MISPARSAAYSILERVERGAYAAELLARIEKLDERDARLCSQIVFGCLRRQAQLDYLMEQSTGKPAARLDAPVRIALRMGLYQLRWLERVPAHAVVGESVELVKRARKASAAALVNAVLRRADRDPGDVQWPTREIALSMPRWLLEGWDRAFGREVSDRIARAALVEPERWLRNPPEHLQVEPAEIPGAYRVLGGDTRGLRLQDIGSQSIVPLLGLGPGMTFLDLCAAPGNKTAQALESGVAAIACDLHLHRLRTVEGCARLVLDAREPLPFRRRFDRILVDAPCSGTGTLGRNPEIRWRLRPEDIEDLHRRQVAILRRALEHLAPGGRLVYSTCSLEPLENEDVVREAAPDRVVEERRRIPGIDPGDGFYAAVLA